jgi:DAK2 domain fusion protein YloV
LDAEAIRRWCAAGLAGLRRHQREIDDLNVFPVPDGDTGTNLVLTFTAAQQQLVGSPAVDLPETMLAFARGALLGARGNSGVIISQLLAGLAGAFELATVTGHTLASALSDAADAAYRSVAEPVEGTILSVARGAARAAGAADSDDLVRVARAAAAGAAAALARTPQQLPELARAGVVDAGGKGLVVLLDALVEVITGVAAPDAPLPAVRDRPTIRETGSSAYAYEVQHLLDAHGSAVNTLKERLAALGDSLVVVGAGLIGATDASGLPVPTWNVHVHVNDVGATIEAAIEAGRPHRISVTRFADQIAEDEGRDVRGEGVEVGSIQVENVEVGSVQVGSVEVGNVEVGDAGVEGGENGAVEGEKPAPFEPAAIVTEPVDAPPATPHAPRATVVVASGAGLAALFEAEGAAIVLGPNPSTAEILDVIRETGATRIVILPDVASTQGTAAAAAAEARAEGIRASIVPTRSPVQALAALAVRDAGRRFEDDVIAMAEAAGACRFAEVTHASREALTVAGRCQPGDVLALVEGEVNLIGSDLVDTSRDLLDRLLAGGGELVTLMLGADAPAGLADNLRAHLAQRWPFVETQVYDGGQPNYPLLVGIE